MAQFSLNNVHKRGLKHDHFISLQYLSQYARSSLMLVTLLHPHYLVYPTGNCKKKNSFRGNAKEKISLYILFASGEIQGVQFEN